MLTVYVLKSGRDRKEEMEKCIESLGKLPTQIIHLPYNPTFDDLNPDTKYKMFIYDAEILHEYLYEAIPQFLRFGDVFDFLSMYKQEMRDGEKKVFISPRIFKSYIKLCRNVLYPENMPDLYGTTILNGWLLDQEVTDANSLRLSKRS